MLVDAAVHASGASKKWLISPFLPASAAKREKYETPAVDKKIQTEINKAKHSTEDRAHRKQFSFQKLIASQ